jgi:phage-related protein
MYGITFNGRHSFNDMGYKILSNREIKSPSKIKVKKSVPYMNGSYDFSNLYGGNCFTDRVLEYTFLLKATSNKNLEAVRMDCENWLMGTNKQTKLIDDNVNLYYYLAECENIEFEDMGLVGKLTATFNAYPFRLYGWVEGNDLWDRFNFELDVSQEVKFDIEGSKDIVLYNQGATHVKPTIIASNDMEIVKDDVTYSIEKGTTNDWRFVLDVGENPITIKGTGTIEFEFRKEVL